MFRTGHPDRVGRRRVKRLARWHAHARRTWPLMPLRGAVLFPGTTMSFDVGRPASLDALREAFRRGRELFVAVQRVAADETPSPEELYPMGTVAKIRQIIEMRDEHGHAVQKVLLYGLTRARIVAINTVGANARYEATLELCPESSDAPPSKTRAAFRHMIKLYERLAAVSGRISPERVRLMSLRRDWGKATDEIVGSTFGDVERSYRILEQVDLASRLAQACHMLSDEIEVIGFEQAIDQKVRSKIDQNQKEYYLREQLRTIREELGEDDGEGDVERFRARFAARSWAEPVRDKLSREIERFAHMSSASPEASVQRTWIETMLELPFGRVDDERHDLKHARRLLNRDHYGMEKVKERIMEHLAVRTLAHEKGVALKGPILCFVGPPGVGKTSIARSIAEALGRRYVRMSLGGVHDEAEIRGHRRTYIGAMPGRIIQGIRLADSDNPLFLLDEIDKLGADVRGDPSSALLEVLDPEQNITFRDHYLEVPYDLSHVLFVMTANTTDTIPSALFDRMEPIDVPGYTEEEKIEIARRHLIPKQRTRHALGSRDVTITKPALRAIIAGYTAEAGVRQLERAIAKICRRAATAIAEDGLSHMVVGVRGVEEILGPPKHAYDKADKEDTVGVARGLAWTWAGGDTLTIEVNVMPGEGKLELTGHLGDVMKESARAALTYIKSRASTLGLAPDAMKTLDIHIHVPAGAIPKDGPSAGITLATALASALTGRAVRHDVAMTGEITLRGRVLAIGGLKEKAAAAHRAGVKTILIPKANTRDLSDVSESIKSQLNVILVDHMDDVLREALVATRERTRERET